jgi:GDP-4-dehydro-6-deoxy-D-mannose reductase
MRVLITGFTGFVGSHLADYLVARGDVEVFGMHRWRSRMENVEHLGTRVHRVECDLHDAAATRRVLRDVRPDRIFHLAAQSYVPTSWLIPGETLTGNVMGEVNLFEGIRDLDLPARVHIAGSSEEYGLVLPDEVPIREDSPLRPLSPYGVSKVTQDLLAYQYWKSYGLHVVRTRGFNHTGPRRGEVFVSSNFSRQIAEIEKGLREPVVRVGNLDSIRDFTDVRDMVRAYWLALERGEPGEVYNVCSGRGYSAHQVLDILLGLSAVRVEIRQDPARMRPSDVTLLVGDYSKFRSITGWEPTIPFEVTLKDLLEHWRKRV